MRTSAALVHDHKVERIEPKGTAAASNTEAPSKNVRLEVLKEKMGRMTSETVSSVIIVSLILALYVVSGLHGFWTNLISRLV